MLLGRETTPVLEAVDRLVGLQAQEPLNPYTALWSRLERFRPDELSLLLVERRVVRLHVMRGTIHLVTAEDALLLRPLMQPVLDAELRRHPEFGPRLAGVDLEPVLTFARALFAEQPRTGRQLRAAMTDRFPDHHPAALAFSCRCTLALVQVPPRGLWGLSAQVTSTTAESWLGRPLAAEPSVDDVVLRYLAAFGPATVADVRAWSGLSGLREVVDRLRPRLVTFRDERGRELVDLPDAPRPETDTPAPPRFLPQYDNLLLSHADRSRFVSEAHRARLMGATAWAHGSVLTDGALSGTWRLDRDRETGGATLVVEPVERLTARAGAALAAEGRRLLGFLAADAEGHEVRLAPAQPA